MKEVLIVGPDFVPSSLPPALRIRLLVRHLPAFGWRPTVVSVDPRYYESQIDPENEALLPADLEVVRTRAFPSGITRRFGVGDIGMRSLWHQWRAVARLCGTRRVDLIFVPMPPHVPSVIGRRARDRFGVPYVLDYQDPWVSDAWRAEPRHVRLPKRRLADGLARALEPYAVRHAAALVGVSKATTDAVVARYPALAGRATGEIPLGGEPADFDYLRGHPRPNPFFDGGDGLVHVSYVGRGGRDLTAAARAVLAAFRRSLEREPARFERLRFHLVGTSYDPRAQAQQPLGALAEELGLGPFVAEHAVRVPYLTALQVMLDSHALVAFGSDQAHYTASKIFPYVLARRPLLAVFHAASTVVRILEETHGGDVVTFDGASQAPPGEPIEAWLARLVSDTPPPAPATRWAEFSRYTAQAVAGRLAALFDTACGDRSPTDRRGR